VAGIGPESDVDSLAVSERYSSTEESTHDVLPDLASGLYPVTLRQESNREAVVAERL
jgi:hypothetical protein